MIFENIDNEKFIDFYKSEKFVLLDIRTQEEYDYIHIKNSVLIDFSDVDFEDKIYDLDRNKKYLLYCRSGKRSLFAMELMKEYNFIEAYNLTKGINEFLYEEYLECQKGKCLIKLPY